MYKGGLESIDGVGPAVRRKILAHFRTIEKIKSATLDELYEVKGVNKNTLKNIFDKFHS